MLKSSIHAIIGFDIETTGLDVQNDHIIELAGINFNNGESFSQTINPYTPIPLYATQIHGITDKDVQDSPGFKDVAIQFIRFCQQQTPTDGTTFLIAHNGWMFDIPMLTIACHNQGIQLPNNWVFIDSLAWAHICLPKKIKKNLQLLREMLNLPARNAHRSLDDSHTLLEVIDILTDNLDVETIFNLTKQNGGYDKMPFGAYKGTKINNVPLSELEPHFRSGLLSQVPFQQLHSFFASNQNMSPDTQLSFN